MWSLSDHLVQLSCMAMIVWGAQAFARRAHRRRVSREARRLRSALHIGLSALRKLYEDNLAGPSASERPLISGRNQINLLRTQLGRLASLEPLEVEAVMAACIAAEGAETEMAIAGRKVGGVAFWIPRKNDAARAITESALRTVCSALRSAEELLNSNGMPRVETVFAVSPNPEADGHKVPAGAAQDNPPYPEKAKIRELSF